MHTCSVCTYAFMYTSHAYLHTHNSLLRNVQHIYTGIWAYADMQKCKFTIATSWYFNGEQCLNPEITTVFSPTLPRSDVRPMAVSIVSFWDPKGGLKDQRRSFRRSFLSFSEYFFAQASLHQSNQYWFPANQGEAKRSRESFTKQCINPPDDPGVHPSLRSLRWLLYYTTCVSSSGRWNDNGKDSMVLGVQVWVDL